MNARVDLVPDKDKYEGDCFAVSVNGRQVGNIYQKNQKSYGSKYYFRSNDDRLYTHGADTLIEMKRGIAEAYERAVAVGEVFEKQTGSKFDIKYLPEGDADDFFPTPKNICGQMIACVNWTNVRTMLEPSAGKGDLYDAVKRFKEKHRYSARLDIDCIEMDTNLRYILKGKGCRVVCDDFLSYNTRKKYDLIIMNPPFSNGDEHLMRAIEMQENMGGQIVCLLNAETLLNPYTKLRKLLLSKIKGHKAVVRYLKSPFKKAERKTDTDIALIYFNIPSKVRESEIFSRMTKAQETKFSSAECKELAPDDKIESLIRAYEVETAASIAFLQEWDALRPRIMNGSESYSKPSIRITIEGHGDCDELTTDTINDYMKFVRRKYWRKLLDLPKINNQMTTAIRNSYEEKINDMGDYEFSMFNIQEVIWAIRAQLRRGVEDEIARLFDKLSNEHSYYENSGNDNIHYYNGWKTNKAHKVNYKVIIPAYGSFAKKYCYDKYNRFVERANDFIDSNSCYSLLADLEKTLDYLDGKDANRQRITLENALNIAEHYSFQTRNIECTYFYVTF